MQLTVPPAAGLAVAVMAWVVAVAVNLAVTLLALVTFVSVQVVPVQSPLKLVKV